MQRGETVTVLAVDVSSGDEELYQDFTGTHPRRVVEGRPAGITASVEVTTVWTPENLTDDMRVAFQNSSVREIEWIPLKYYGPNNRRKYVTKGMHF